MTNKRGEIGDPYRVPTVTGVKTLADTWKSSRQDLPVRKDLVLDTRSGLTPMALSIPQRVDTLTLLKPPMMSRKRVETFLLSFCIVLIRWVRVLHGSDTDKPARDPHLSGLGRPVTRDTQDRRPFMILSKILEKVWRRTITRKEEGES